ncbi:OmpA family protein [Sandaracinobacteroides saxicola]|uniref:OmpA family protein n=1 Tax=Sandaracinobacteroides saxicola TaxID=2759707 RepID=A0A7G5IJ01_9SPHN|nr:OmpA family protein [Sandaracinobacteroides saxicola]QMW23343.1 OmpA family protein [Sandaracinobacteroides saxicola]
MTGQDIVRRVSMVALLGALLAGPVQAQSVEDLAGQLAAKPKPKPAETPGCEKKLPDGSCPDIVDTRQMRLGGGSAGATAAKSVRQDISMTFMAGSAQLTASAMATLDRFAKALSAVGNYRPFTVEGHTDRSGSREVNQALSKARAESVVNYLAAKGVDRSRMTPRGFGFDRTLPGRSATDPANRRVEVSAN